MIRIIDTVSQINSLFENQCFNINKWEQYINSVLPNPSHIFKDDLNNYFTDGSCSFEKDFLPIINAVYGNPKMDCLHQSFTSVVNDLNNKILSRFGSELDVDIVLYLGLCNAAGWATEINGKDVILLGVEKILELDWCDACDMHGLIYHELGHIYHKQFGMYDQTCENSQKTFIWQLFKEGFAMYFEQCLVNDFDYFHQDKNGWKQWCDQNLHQIITDFNNDLPTMNRQNQRYFGDTVNYHGYGDVGYYLGTRFVQYLAERYGIEEIIKFDIDIIFDHYMSFITR